MLQLFPSITTRCPSSASVTLSRRAADHPDACSIRADWLLTVRANDGVIIDISGPRPWIMVLPASSSMALGDRRAPNRLTIARPLAAGDHCPIPIPQIGTPFTWRLVRCCHSVPTLVAACAHWIPPPIGDHQQDQPPALLCLRVADASTCDVSVMFSWQQRGLLSREDCGNKNHEPPASPRCKRICSTLPNVPPLLRGGRILPTRVGSTITLRVSAAGIIDLALLVHPSLDSHPSLLPSLFGAHILSIISTHASNSVPLLRAFAKATSPPDALAGRVHQVTLHVTIAGKVDLGLTNVLVFAADEASGRAYASVTPSDPGAIVGECTWEHTLQAAGLLVTHAVMFPEIPSSWVLAERSPGRFSGEQDLDSVPAGDETDVALLESTREVHFVSGRFMWWLLGSTSAASSLLPSWIPTSTHCGGPLAEDAWYTAVSQPLVAGLLTAAELSFPLDSVLNTLSDACAHVRAYIHEFLCYLCERTKQVGLGLGELVKRLAIDNGFLAAVRS